MTLPLGPQQPSVTDTAPPVPPPNPTFADYKAHLENTLPKNNGFYIDASNKVAIKIIDVDNKPSLIKIPISQTDNGHLDSVLPKFNDTVCTKMVQAARSIGLGQGPTRSGKEVSAVKFEIGDNGISTQKMYANNPEGKLRTFGYYKTKSTSNSALNNEKKLGYKKSANLLDQIKNDILPSISKPRPPIPTPAIAEQNPVPVDVPANSPIHPQPNQVPSSATDEARLPKPSKAASSPAPTTRAELNKLLDEMTLTGKMGNSEYTYEDLKKSIIKYSETPKRLDAFKEKIKIQDKEVEILAIFKSALENKPSELKDNEKVIFDGINKIVERSK